MGNQVVETPEKGHRDEKWKALGFVVSSLASIIGGIESLAG
jgi:hypothetical protein